MVNEIKLDRLAAAQSIAKTPRKEVNAQLPASQTEGITITNHLGSLANTVIADNALHDNHQRVMELKQQIQNNQYRVDIDRLASKLSHLFLTVNQDN